MSLSSQRSLSVAELVDRIHTDADLTAIFLKDVPLSEKDLELLLHTLTSRRGKLAIDELHLEGNNLTSLDLVCNLIEAIPLLKALRISRNSLEQTGMTRLGQAISSCRHLTSLDLSRNSLTSQAIRPLTAAMSSASLLTHLSFRDNEIDSDGGMAITKLLTLHAVPIATLDMGLNSLGDSGAMALSHVVEQSTTLKQLLIDCNYITAMGAKALAESLASTCSVEALSIEDNKLGDEGVAVLEAACEQSSTLRELSTRGNKTMLSGTSI